MASANPFYLPSAVGQLTKRTQFVPRPLPARWHHSHPPRRNEPNFSLPPLPAQWLHPCISDETNPILPSSVRGSVAPPREKCEKKVEKCRHAVMHRPHPLVPPH